MRKVCCLSVAVLTLGVAAIASIARAEESYTRQQDVIYGRKFGTALTMDVFTPKANANGAALILCISGGWISDHDRIQPAVAAEPLKRGYTVFAVVHGSQPKFTIPECVDDMHRAVRYIRTHAAEFKIDPNRIGVTGASAGGHLSLMLGCAPREGNPKAKDPVERANSNVQAVACFFPPTDFLNYGTPGFAWLNRGPKDAFQAPFDFHVWNPDLKRFDVVDEEARVKIAREVSPVYHVTADDPPTLIIHGDKDILVPIQQSHLIVAKLKEAGVPCELVVKTGEAHGWRAWQDDMRTVADWFDKYLKPAAAASQ